MNTKRIIIMILLILVITTTGVFAGVQFGDIPANAWYKSHLDYATNKGIINGYPDGTFKPEDNLTRAAFTKVIVYALEGEQKKGINILKKWYTPYYDKGESLGILPNEFLDLDKDSAITRGEMATVISRLPNLKLDKTKGSNNIKDYDLIASNQQAAVVKTYQSGIINGYPDGTFKANDTLTRAQLTKIAELVSLLNEIDFKKCANSELDNLLGLSSSEWSKLTFDEKLNAKPNWTYEHRGMNESISLEGIININPYLLQVPDANLMVETKTIFGLSTSSSHSLQYYKNKDIFGIIGYIYFSPLSDANFDYEPGFKLIEEYLEQFTENPFKVNYKGTISKAQVKEVLAKLKEIIEIDKAWHKEHEEELTKTFNIKTGFRDIDYTTLPQPMPELFNSITKLTVGQYEIYIQPSGRNLMIQIFDKNHPDYPKTSKEFWDFSIATENNSSNTESPGKFVDYGDEW